MREYLPILKTSSLFCGMDSAETEAILKCLSARTALYSGGGHILWAGDAPDSVGLLLSGSAIIAEEDYWGNRNIIAKLQAGDVFAEAFACSPGTVIRFAVAAETDCTVLWLAVSRILTTCPTACSHHSRMVRNLLSALAAKNVYLSEKLTHMSRRTTREKVLSYLSSEAQKQNRREFDVAFNRQQLADYLSVERSALSAELSKLRDAGVIAFERNHFVLL